MMKNEPFYTEGLYFSCTRCSDCCRHESGFVFVSETDVTLLAKEFKMNISEFVNVYCRWIPSDKVFAAEDSTERLSLKEKSNYDCIFWDMGCKVYKSRPLQCRAFPFWPGNLNSRKTWERIQADCPGMGKGAFYSREAIENILKSQSSEPILTRKAQSSGRS